MSRGGKPRRHRWADPRTKRLVGLDALELDALHVIRAHRDRFAAELADEAEQLGQVDSTWGLVIEGILMMTVRPGKRATVGGLTLTEVRRLTGTELNEVSEQLRSPRMKPENDLATMAAKSRGWPKGPARTADQIGED